MEGTTVTTEEAPKPAEKPAGGKENKGGKAVSSKLVTALIVIGLIYLGVNMLRQLQRGEDLDLLKAAFGSLLVAKSSGYDNVPAYQPTYQQPPSQPRQSPRSTIQPASHWTVLGPDEICLAQPKHVDFSCPDGRGGLTSCRCD